ncbi:MAG: MerR family transcriptional regulator [Nocardioides sp.]
MRASKAAAAAGVTVKALRYYESLDLLRPRRQANGYRVYRAEDVRIAREIRRLSAMGLSASETAPFLACLDAGHPTGDDCDESRVAYSRRLGQVDDAIARLGRTREEIRSRLEAAAHDGFAPMPTAREERPMIDIDLPAGNTVPALTRTFAACLASVLDVPASDIPLPDGGLDRAIGTWGAWLAARGSGLVPIADPRRFQWAGWWIAVLRREADRGDQSAGGGGETAILAFGTPPGVVLSPRAPDLLGRATADLPITAAYVVASMDPALPPPSPAPVQHGIVEGLALAPTAEAPMRLVSAARVLAGRGLEGDRYASGAGTFSTRGDRRPGYDLTIIAAEVLDELAAAGRPLTFADTRRTVLTRGLDLNALVGHTFTIDGIRCRGVRLCEPCAHLERLSGPGLLRPMIHRGGLRVDVLDTGRISLGATVSSSAEPGSIAR